jgi:hypothetical protein
VTSDLLFALITQLLRKEEFSEVHGYKRAPIWVPRLPLPLHTSPARSVYGLVGSICGEGLLEAVATCYGPTYLRISQREAPTEHFDPADLYGAMVDAHRRQ